MTFQYISVYLTVLLYQFLTTESQYMPQGHFPFPPGGASMPMPGMPQRMPMPGQMPYPMPQSRMPMVVMPYSKSGRKQGPNFRKKPKRKHINRKKYSFDDSTSSSDRSDNSDSYSNEFNLRSGNRKRKPKGQRRRQVLTPVVSYVTKEGYVIYQKKIKKDRAKDWLEMGKKKPSNMLDSDHEQDDSHEIYREAKTKRRHRFSKKSNDY